MKHFEDKMVSVIMPMYNSEKYIEVSIQSVINQTYPYWELIIVDDCSNDRSVNIVEKYVKLDKRLKLLNSKKNSGVAKSRNQGIKLAQGRYIAFLDSDDVWLPEKLKYQIEFMQEMQAPMSYTQYRHFTNEICNSGKIIDVELKISYKDLLKGNIIGCLTVMIDRKKIKDIYFSNYKHEDYILWLYILKKGFCAYGIKEDLARYRKSPNSLTGNKIKSFCWTWNVYRNREKLSPLKSLYYLFFYIIKGIKKHL